MQPKHYGIPVYTSYNSSEYIPETTAKILAAMKYHESIRK